MSGTGRDAGTGRGANGGRGASRRPGEHIVSFEPPDVASRAGSPSVSPRRPTGSSA